MICSGALTHPLLERTQGAPTWVYRDQNRKHHKSILMIPSGVMKHATWKYTVKWRFLDGKIIYIWWIFQQNMVDCQRVVQHLSSAAIGISTVHATYLN
jgi:hypothetical protein